MRRIVDGQVDVDDEVTSLAPRSGTSAGGWRESAALGGRPSSRTSGSLFGSVTGGATGTPSASAGAGGGSASVSLAGLVLRLHFPRRSLVVADRRRHQLTELERVRHER